MRRMFVVVWLMGLVSPGAVYARDLNIVTYNVTVNSLWQFVSSVPADNALLNASPPAVTITFSQNINPDAVKSAVSVYDPYNNPLGNISVTVNGPSMSAQLPRLQAGTYRVEWRTDCLCKDSSPLSGTLRFTVQ